MRRTHKPLNVTRSTKLRWAQRSAELALRSTDFRVPENPIFPVLSTKLEQRPPGFVELSFIELSFLTSSVVRKEA